MKKRLRLAHYAWSRRARFQNRRALLRALWWFGVRAYRFEICFSCGRPVGLVWAADDQIWLDVFENRGGICCIGCFDRRFAQETGVILHWKPTPDPEFEDQVRMARVYKVRDHLSKEENDRLTNPQIERFLENKYQAMSAAEAAALLGMTLWALDDWCQARFEQSKGGTESGADQEGDPAEVPTGRAAREGIDPGEGADSTLRDDKESL